MKAYQTEGSCSSLWSDAAAGGHLWQRRFYDFMVWTARKRVEKLRYIHRNPVQRGLVLEPDQWRWSSYRAYAYAERGPVLVNEPKKAELKMRDVARAEPVLPTLRNPRRVGQPAHPSF